MAVNPSPGAPQRGPGSATAPAAQPPSPSVWSAIKQSFTASIGDIVFGMEDGTVSIFGLVFGLAVTAASSKSVLLAGATGAIAAAVSMMAGAYLDVTSTRSIANSKIDAEWQEIQHNFEEEAHEAAHWLRADGFPDPLIKEIVKTWRQHPKAMLKFQISNELDIGGLASESPYAHAAWMFVADLVAASIPVIPFAFLPLGPARWVSVTITALLLTGLGVGRAVVAKTNLIITVVETLGIATGAAIAGVLIGQLINHLAG